MGRVWSAVACHWFDAGKHVAYPHFIVSSYPHFFVSAFFLIQISSYPHFFVWAFLRIRTSSHLRFLVSSEPRFNFYSWTHFEINVVVQCAHFSLWDLLHANVGIQLIITGAHPGFLFGGGGGWTKEMAGWWKGLHVLTGAAGDWTEHNWPQRAHTTQKSSIVLGRETHEAQYFEAKLHNGGESRSCKNIRSKKNYVSFWSGSKFSTYS